MQLAPVDFRQITAEETYSLLQLLEATLQLVLRLPTEDPLYTERIQSIFGLVTVFAPVFIENEMKWFVMSPMNFRVLYLYVVLAVKVCKRVAIKEIIGNEQLEYLYEYFKYRNF